MSRDMQDMQFVAIPSGGFRMGSDLAEPDRCDDESQHDVAISKSFHMAVHPVTRGQFAVFAHQSGYQTDAERAGFSYAWVAGKWVKVEGAGWRTPGYEQDDTHPAVCISWNDATAFNVWLGRVDGTAYRLASEAEWEYACRAGTCTPFHFGSTISPHEANYDATGVYAAGQAGDYRRRTTPVGSFPPNAFGLHDMLGNVWEWCADWYGPYPAGEVIDPAGPAAGRLRILRGGSWANYPRCCRSAFRFRNMPDCAVCDIGFRLCRQ